jgi:hypothetical protein
VADHDLIGGYLAGLAGRVPRDAVDELADGLIETWQHHQRAGLDPTTAAEAAIAEFGSVERVGEAFVTAAPGRRVSRLLLASGPVVGAWWGVSLAADHAWSWPADARVVAGCVLLLPAVVLCLLAAATTRHSYRRTRLGIFGACGVVALDLGMVAAALLLAPVLIWPMAVAVPISLTRVAVVLSRLSRRALAV